MKNRIDNGLLKIPVGKRFSIKGLTIRNYAISNLEWRISPPKSIKEKRKKKSQEVDLKRKQDANVVSISDVAPKPEN